MLALAVTALAVPVIPVIPLVRMLSGTIEQPVLIVLLKYPTYQAPSVPTKLACLRLSEPSEAWRVKWQMFDGRGVSTLA